MSERLRLPLLVSVIVIALSATESQAGSGRRALLVGSHRGDANEAPLRHTSSDVARVREVLTGWGRFAAQDIEVLEDVQAADVLARLDALTADGASKETFVFYYSGHADAGALHLGGSRLALDALIARLKRIQSTLRIAVLDACQSGGALRGKGVVRAPAFDIGARETEASGVALLSSSSADEESFESDGVGGAVFTLHLTSGLRGAADADTDGQVTLHEAARYAYAQTVRSTLNASSGPQHPMFRLDLVGRRDPVLAWIDSSATLTFTGQSEREYIIFDEGEQRVMAEVNAAAGAQPRVALAPGTYVIRQRSDRGARMARIALSRGDHRVLPEHQMKDIPLLPLAQKGAFGQRWLLGSVGQWGSLVWQGWGLQIESAVEWERPRWTFGAQLGLVRSARDGFFHANIEVRETLVSPGVYALWAARTNLFTFRTGPVLSVSWTEQSVSGDQTRRALQPSVGWRLRGDFTPHPRLGFSVGLTPHWMMGRYDEAHDSLYTSLGGDWLGYLTLGATVGTRVSW